MVHKNAFGAPELLAQVQSIVNEMSEGLPEPLFVKKEDKVFMVEMRDGIKLFTRVFYPEGSGPWPVIVIRDCYKESNPQAHISLIAFSETFVQHGYVVVLQDVRGTGDSDGEWEPIVNERNDGLDTINWVTKQKWMDGNIGLFGNSYRGTAAFSTIDQLPKQVKTMFVSMFSINRYKGYYQDGMFKHDIYTSWAIENAGIKTVEKKSKLYKKAINIRPHIEMDKQLFGVELPWYREQITNVGPMSDYWSKGPIAEIKSLPGKVKIPIFLLGGWFDHHLDGMAEIYERLPEKAKRESIFLIGPWGHNFKSVGDLAFPNSETIGIYAVKPALKWFNHLLKKLPLDDSTGVMETYVIRANKWRTSISRNCKKNNLRLYLRKNDIQAYKGGSLTLQKGENDKRLSYHYNPNDPVPSKGSECLYAWMCLGLNDAPPGSVLQDNPGERLDVLTFLSEPIKENMLIEGRIHIYLTVSSDAEDTSFTAKIMEMFPDGKSYNIRDIITSLSYRNGSKTQKVYKPGDVIGINMKTWPIAWMVKKGSRLRVDISSSNFPAYHVHPNVHGIWAKQSETKVANQTLFLGGKHSSFVEIPVAKDI